MPPGRISSTRLGGRIRVLETWFDDDPASLDGWDVWIAHQRSRPLSRRGWLFFYTIQVDLTQGPDELLAHMRKNTSREIRQAQSKGGLACDFNSAPTPEDVETFARFYDENPHAPGQLPMDRPRLEALRSAGLLHLVTASTPEGTVLVRHALLAHTTSGIIQLFALPTLRVEGKEAAGLIGRTNRWLFYQEFLAYRERGFSTYDLNGWYAGVEDEKRLNINTFKEGFRGRILHGFDCMEGSTLKGRLFLLAKHLKGLLLENGYRKERLRRRTKAPRLPED